MKYPYPKQKSTQNPIGPGSSETVAPAPLTTVEPLIAEADVLKQWPVLSRALLLAARKQGRIAWVRGKRGSPFYRPSAIEEFIHKELEQPCRAHAHDHSLNSAANGSPTTQHPDSSIVSGLSPVLEEHAARAYAQKI
jgi:hypothetical protein